MDHQAFAQLLGNYGEFFGAIAVLLTLIYLAIQTRLTRKAAEESANFASSQATYTAVEQYDKWRASILENPENARIVIKARGPEVLQPEEKYLYDLLFERLFFVGAVSVQSSVHGATFHSWETGDVRFLLDLFDKNPTAIDGWKRARDTVRSISPTYVDAVDEGLRP